ncbi:hypothetical protein D3C80_664530 [compost metagenome]
MLTQNPAVHVDDLAGFTPLRTQAVDQGAVVARRHEADVLAVRLGGDAQAERRGDAAHLGLFQIGQGEAQIVELILGRGEQEVGLVARVVDRLAHLRAVADGGATDIVAGGHGFGAQVAGHVQQVAELDRLIAPDAGDRRLALQITVRELVDHRVLEAAFVVQDIVRNADQFGGQTGVVDVLTGAAGALLLERGAVVIELQRDADHVIAGLGQQGGDDGGIHPARHGRDHARADRQADGLSRALDRGVHVGGAGHGGDGRNGTDVVSQGHRRHIEALAVDFEAWAEIGCADCLGNKKGRPCERPSSSDASSPQATSIR